MSMFKVLIACVFICIVKCNLIHNGDFETSTVEGLAMWNESDGKIAFSTVFTHGGKVALESYHRIHIDDGPKQYVAVQPGVRYEFQVYIKQKNDQLHEPTQTYKTSIVYTMDQGRPVRLDIAVEPAVKSSQGWFLIEGCFLTPNRSFSSALLSVHGPQPVVSFLVDDFSLDEISEVQDPDLEAYNSIRRIRRNHVHFVFEPDSHMNKSDLMVKVQMKRHAFGFGAHVNLMPAKDIRYHQYHHFIRNYFNSATVSHLGWPVAKTNYCYKDAKNVLCMDAVKGDNSSFQNINYLSAMDTVNTLKSNGLKVRGEPLFGRTIGPVPGWVHQLDAQTLENMMSTRATYMNSLFNNQIDQWNVLNDPIDDRTYEQMTSDPNFSEKVMQFVHKADPSVKLMIDEHNVISGGSETQAYKHLAIKLIPYGLSVIGAKGLLNTEVFDPTLIKRRLDSLGETGLPIWITELSVADKDVMARASKLEKVLRFLYGHPAVAGVTLKGVYDRVEGPPYTALFNGSGYTPNAAGIRYHNLQSKEWSSQVTRKLNFGLSFDQELYHGDYQVSVFHKGQLIKTDSFTVGKADLIYQMSINDLPVTPHGSSPASTPAVKHHLSPHEAAVDTRGRHPVGIAKSGGTSLQPLCTSRWSGRSASTANAVVTVECRGEEVLTGCASIGLRSSQGSWSNDGQSLVKQTTTGRILCQAKNGNNGGVYAVAQCCSGKDLACGYYGAGPSQPVDDQLIEVRCPQHYLALGCSGLQENSKSKGSFPTGDMKACRTRNGGSDSGAMTYAACCYLPGMSCKSMYSKPSGGARGDESNIACEGGYKMTSCQALSSAAEMSGAVVKYTDGKEECVAVNGAHVALDQTGTVAVATCCKVDPVGALHGASTTGNWTVTGSTTMNINPTSLKPPLPVTTNILQVQGSGGNEGPLHHGFQGHGGPPQNMASSDVK